MGSILAFSIDLMLDKQVSSVMNLPLLIITLVILLIALLICIAISKKNKLYINLKQDKNDSAYT